MTDTPGLTDWLQAIAALSSAIAAGAALWIAWKGPRSAARLAEELRTTGQRQEEVRREKIKLFFTLMEERSSLGSPNVTAALNRAEAVFMDSDDLRRELRTLHDLAHIGPVHGRDELMNKQFIQVIHTMANGIGFEGRFSDADFNRVFGR